ncbi:YusW family protein [Halalkalibacillus halophilus]|uniref:YusW family protein n=1 Tax=Halalkalibacillus halophilus TaxID=392827 RepID=UPI0004085A5B|nr:YusW family protein [Halalkalibacillus halophilus]
MKKLLFILVAALFLAACGTDVESEEDTTGNQADQETEEQTNNEEENNTEEPSSEEADENEEASENEETTSNENQEASGDYDVSSVHEFDLQIEFTDDTEWEYEYERNDMEDTEIEKDGKETVKGEAAAEEIESLMAEFNITTDRTLVEMKEEVLAALNLSQDEVEDFDLEIKFESGEEIVFDHESVQNENQGNVREFDMDIDFFSGDDWEYEYEADDQEAEIERGNEEIEGSAAMTEIEELLSNISITMDRSIQEMKQEVLNALDVNEDDVKDFDIDVEYENGETVKFKHDVE